LLTEDQLPVIRRTEVDGIPTLWTPAPGPLTGALHFRVGRVDEARPIAGITHLVEHLAFHELLDTQYEHGGFVDVGRTVFHASGHPHEVAEFLGRIVANLDALPLDRLEHERGVLVQEANERGAGSVDGHLRWLRFGPVDHGIVDGAEVGLDWLGAEPVAAWRRTRFTRDNAALFFTGEPPADLRLPLAAGHRYPPVPAVPSPDIEWPAWTRWDRDGVGMSLVGARSSGLSMLTWILERRLKRVLRHELGAVYDVSAAYDPITADDAHIFVYTECAPERAIVVRDAMASTLADLATAGPTEEELAREIDGFERQFLDPGAGVATLDIGVFDILHGGEVILPADAYARRRGVTIEAARDVAATVRATALLASPTDAPPDGFRALRETSVSEVRGREIGRSGRHLPGRGPKERLIIGDEGVTLRYGDGTCTTVRYAELVTSHHLSNTSRRLLARDGFGFTVDAADWKDGASLIPELDRHIDPLTVACIDDGDNAGWARRIESPQP
jgi:zinc protease